MYMFAIYTGLRLYLRAGGSRPRPGTAIVVFLVSTVDWGAKSAFVDGVSGLGLKWSVGRAPWPDPRLTIPTEYLASLRYFKPQL